MSEEYLYPPPQIIKYWKWQVMWWELYERAKSEYCKLDIRGSTDLCKEPAMADVILLKDASLKARPRFQKCLSRILECLLAPSNTIPMRPVFRSLGVSPPFSTIFPPAEWAFIDADFRIEMILDPL